ncbi:MAG: FHA domain-containing protein [Candidatus Magnetominusculus sp. LBB02]|nr:FHA domain-containing protein [Candidatus Magnetominusculus sp. LBB02]
MAKILLKFKEAALKEIPLDKETITIGRKATNDIHVDNLAVSGAHARIFKKGEQFYIEDLSSLNGTFVNGKKVSVGTLNDADVIIIGKHTLTFVSEAQPKKQAEQSKDKDLMDETIMIDPKLKDAILSKAPKADAVKVEQKEILGGFVVIEGSTEKREYELTDRISTIGKDPNSLIKLKGFFAPKVAALINRKKDGYTISSLAGGKGVRVNGNEIENQYKLNEGDVVDVSGIKLQFYVKEN